MSAPQFLHTSDGRSIAYHKTQGAADRPGVVFLGGFKSDMEGSKALHLEAWAKSNDRSFLRFDYTGHGQSSGVFEDGCIGDWARDAHDAIGQLTSGQQILIGSSMGGWISLLFARAAPERIAALVGIAAAPDFTLSMRAEMDDAARREMAETGRWSRPSEYSDDPYVITRRLLDDGDENLVLDRPLNFGFPVRLLQGAADTDVPVSVATRLLDHIEADDMRLTVVKGADHRFSEPGELALLIKTIEDLA